MIAAAAALFARAGFHGVTTRDIAQSASVSEGNLFRYFPSKRELFFAAIDYELNKLRVRAQALQRGESAGDSRAALRALFDLITETVTQEPALVRLLQFSALEFGSEMEPIYRKHLNAILDLAASNLEQWSRNPGFRNVHARVTVLSFVVTVVLLQMYPALTGAGLPLASLESAAAQYAELWYRVLCQEPADGLGNCADLPASGCGKDIARL
jgi:AcrR family transcriptional regulator